MRGCLLLAAAVTRAQGGCGDDGVISSADAQLRANGKVMARMGFFLAIRGGAGMHSVMPPGRSARQIAEGRVGETSNGRRDLNYG